jgi:hypothetical protein
MYDTKICKEQRINLLHLALTARNIFVYINKLFIFFFSTKWLYFCVGFVLVTLQFGLVFSFGALFTSIRDTFQTDRPTTATVHALLTTSFCKLLFLLFISLHVYKFIPTSSIDTCVTFC